MSDGVCTVGVGLDYILYINKYFIELIIQIFICVISQLFLIWKCYIKINIYITVELCLKAYFQEHRVEICCFSCNVQRNNFSQ